MKKPLFATDRSRALLLLTLSGIATLAVLPDALRFA